jgi:hypothetical protein
MAELAAAERDFFWEHGYVVVEDAVDASLLAELRRDFDGWIEESRRHSDPYGDTADGRPRFDLEQAHTADRPGLRRVNAPVEVSDAYFRATADSRMTDCVADLIGPAVKLHHTKINSKLPGGHTEVKWHQDFPFTPHSNDDIVTALLMVDEVTEENGPLKVLPGSHRGPIHGLWHGGAFTGALSRRRGRFELADGGTIFLDEIGEISQNIQIKLLRILQERAFERVGGEETITADVRLVTATNRDLLEAIEEGTFREDLYYRLNVVHIDVPPLRERQADISLLAAGFLSEFAEENGKQLVGFKPSALSALRRYSWPGNVRELQNSIESAVVMARGSTIDLHDLPPAVRRAQDAPAVRIPLGSTLDHGERELIRATLNHQHGNKSRTADILGISRKTLHRKISEYQLGD